MLGPHSGLQNVLGIAGFGSLLSSSVLYFFSVSFLSRLSVQDLKEDSGEDSGFITDVGFKG